MPPSPLRNSGPVSPDQSRTRNALRRVSAEGVLLGVAWVIPRPPSPPVPSVQSSHLNSGNSPPNRVSIRHRAGERPRLALGVQGGRDEQRIRPFDGDWVADGCPGRGILLGDLFVRPVLVPRCVEVSDDQRTTPYSLPVRCGKVVRLLRLRRKLSRDQGQVRAGERRAQRRSPSETRSQSSRPSPIRRWL